MHFFFLDCWFRAWCRVKVLVRFSIKLRQGSSIQNTKGQSTLPRRLTDFSFFFLSFFSLFFFMIAFFFHLFSHEFTRSPDIWLLFSESTFILVRCPHCQGNGKRIHHACPKCRGQGTLMNSHQLDVKIEKGEGASPYVVCFGLLFALELLSFCFSQM